MPIQTLTELRYLKREQLEKSAKIMANYYRDIIYQYGVDAVIFKQDTEFPTIINPSLDSIENIIYGENTSMSYSTSASIPIFLEVEQDIFNINQEGSLPNQHYIASIFIDDYASKFAYILGGNDEFKTTLSLSGVVDNYTASLSSDFEIEGLSGVVSYDFELSGGNTSGYYTPTISNLSPDDYQREVLINPYIKESKSYTITDDDHFTAFVGDYTATVDVSGNGTVSSNLYGSLLYTSIDSINRYRDKIRPSVGDLIRVYLTDDVNFEDYEITQVYDRVLSDGGINPLLHKYIYRCDVVRRIPDEENIFGDYDDMEQYSKDNLDVLGKVEHAREIISNEVDDYSDNVDDVYGGYGSGETSIPDVEEYDGTDTVDVLTTIFEFGETDANIYTNGWDLYFKNNESDISKITMFHVEQSGLDIPTGLMYLKTDGVDLFFNNKNSELARLTNNSGDRTTQIPLGTKLNDFEMGGNVSGDMIYKFKSSKTILFSDGINLFTRNNDGIVTRLTNN